MGGVEALAFALSALTGGVVGSAAAAYLAGLRVAGSLEGFKAVFNAYMEGRSDEPSHMVRAAIEEVDSAWSSFRAALDRLGRAIRAR